jgi:hypothetical protein
LNVKELSRILSQNVKVFFMLCHGELKNVQPPTSNFCLEKKGHPTLLDEFDEKRLLLTLTT